jgi:acyl-coenzyme A thioesterase PaaI-like protein
MLASLLADDARTNAIRKLWDTVHRIPGGSRLFSRAIGLAAPYTGTIDAHVEVLQPGRAEVTMRDRRGLRNHIRCVHAVALANLAELAGNVALAYSLPDDGRFIVAGMSLEYVKKARGPLRAFSECEVPATSERREVEVRVSIRDASGTEVTRASLRTLIGPKKKA